jgi:hypothetical protein
MVVVIFQMHKYFGKKPKMQKINQMAKKKNHFP